MRAILHEGIESRWQELTLPEQLGNVGSEVGRAAKWQDKDDKLFWGAVERALELFDLTLDDTRWKGRHTEIARARELFVDAIYGGKMYKSTLPDLERYFMQFAWVSRNSLLN